MSKTALVTGASSGIGLELAKLFAGNGNHVVLVARNREALEALASDLQNRHGITATVLPADLAVPSAPPEIYRELRDRGIRIDYLVNNAGFGTQNAFAETDSAVTMEMIQVNIAALTHLTALFLNDMLAQKSGRILNVASTAAFQPGPWMAVYYATKAYVLSFSEALDAELKSTGVTVTTLCPGPTPTGFQGRAGSGETRLMKSKFVRVMSAEAVARAGYESLLRGERVVIPGFGNRVLAIGARIGPRSISTAIAGALNKKK